MSQLARDSGLTREGLYKALSAEGNPSFGTVWKVADAMGYRFALVSKAKKTPRRASKSVPANKTVPNKRVSKPRISAGI